MEPIRLWRFSLPTTFSGRKYPSPMHYEDGDPLHLDDEGCTERFAALPRADFDALVRERDEAVSAARVCREDAEINAARAEKAEALLREIRAAFASGGVCDECKFSARIDALMGEAPGPDDRKGEDGEAIFDARLYGKTRFVPSPVPGGPRMLDFDVLRAIGIAVAMRARDIPTSTPEQCVDAVLADLGIEKNPGPPALVQFESQIVFCRVCGKPPQQHPFGPCGD